jgi:hypothetical protein
LVPIPPTVQPKESSDACGKGEDRGTQMSDPASEKKRSRGTGQIVGLERHGPSVEEIAHMIQRHEDHHQAAQGVYGLNAWDLRASDRLRLA